MSPNKVPHAFLMVNSNGYSANLSNSGKINSGGQLRLGNGQNGVVNQSSSGAKYSNTRCYVCNEFGHTASFHGSVGNFTNFNKLSRKQRRSRDSVQLTVAGGSNNRVVNNNSSVLNNYGPKVLDSKKNYCTL